MRALEPPSELPTAAGARMLGAITASNLGYGGIGSQMRHSILLIALFCIVLLKHLLHVLEDDTAVLA